MKFFLLSIALIFNVYSKAQLTVTTNSNANSLAQKIVGQGIVILNPVYKGNAVSAGFFNDRTGTIGIDSGIVLTTGRALTISNISNGLGINGNASLKAGYANGSPSDADLNNLISGTGTRQDACVLEFDFIPQGDSINVKFVFASEEYTDYNCTDYNDVFGFLVSGPGIVGKQNIALVPGTNVPVSINSINDGRPGPTGNISNCTNMGHGAPFTSLYKSNTGNQYLTYNGLTKVLTASMLVQPCQTYHIKLAIQDVFDGDFDSGVFLEASSFSSNVVVVANSGGFNDNQNNTIVVEGCKNSKVKISLDKPATSNISLPLSYSGTASFGTDYLPMPSSITFLPGEFEKELDVVAVMDNVAEPTETIIVSVGVNSCSSGITSNVTVFIKDSIGFYNTKDTFVCSKFPTLLIAPKVDTANNKYLWSTADTSQQLNITLPNTYWVVHTFSNRCFNIDTFKVVNGDPTVSLGGNILFCNKDSVLVSSIVSPVGGNYLWSTGGTTPSLYISQSGYYSLKYTAPNGCYLVDALTSTVKPLPYPFLGRDTSLCSYENITLNAYYPGATYNWSTGANTASINVSDSALYFVTNTLNGCKAADSIVVGRKKSPVANAGQPITILAGGTARLKALQTINNDTYLWFPSSFLTTPNQYNTNANPITTANYYLKVTSKDNCVAYDTILITVKDVELDIPNAFSPNGDGINETWEINLLSSYIFAKVQVFNRYGQPVFTSTGYDKAWDGTNNGKPIPVGTYYYVIEPGFGRKTRTGWVTIIR